MIPDLSVLWVIFFVLTLTIIVQALIFKPILRVMRERASAVESAKALAADAEARARAAADEYDAKTGAARAEVYREMDATRRAALDRRAELLALTKQEAEETQVEATARIQKAADQARQQLQADATTLSQAIVDRVLDRKAS